MDARDRYPIAEKELIDYISSILLSQKQELREKMEGMRQDLNVITTDLGSGKSVSTIPNAAYNDAIRDVLNLLT